MLASETPHARVTSGQVGVPASVETDIAKKRLDTARRKRDEEARRLMQPWLDAVPWREATQSRAPFHSEIVSLHEVLAEGGLCDGISPPKGGNGDVEVTCVGQTCLSVDGRVDVRLATRKRFASVAVRRLALQSGDILMVRVNGSVQRCGAAALLEHTWGPMACASGILRLRLNMMRADPLILLHWLRMPQVRSYMMSGAHGTLQAYITQEHIRALPCPRLVGQLERREIASRLRDLDEEVLLAASVLPKSEKRRGQSS